VNVKKNRRRNNVARKSNKPKFRVASRIMRVAIAIVVVVLVLWPLMAMTASAEPLAIRRYGRTSVLKPDFGRVGTTSPRVSDQYSNKVSGVTTRIGFSDSGHGNGTVSGVLGELALDGVTATSFSFYDGSAGTGFVSAMSVIDNQVQTLNWNTDWTLWTLDSENKRLTRKPDDQFSVPAYDVLIPVSKRSAIFAGSGKVFTAKATAKNRLSMPSTSEMMRVETYSFFAYTSTLVYIYNAYTTELVVYKRSANGQIDQASKTLVTYVNNLAAMTPFGNDLIVYTRHWDDAGEAAYGSLLMIPNAAFGNALPAVLEERVTGFDVNSWVGNAFIAIDDGTGNPAIVTVNHQYGPNGNIDQIVARTSDGVWHKVPTPDGMYITTLSVINQ
jgi:hypothetical protein